MLRISAARTPNRSLLAGLLSLALAGCVVNPADNGQALMDTLPSDVRIVMMPPDIRYYLMTAGGSPELHETWTADAETGFASAMDNVAQSRGIDIDVLGRDQVTEEMLQLESLHSALGEALIEHTVMATRLPSKGDNDISGWSLGPGVRTIRDMSDADYALFVHYRENQASGSRLAFAILAAAAHVTIPTSSEHGFATLIDLESGNVEWFGVLYDDGYEIREEAGAYFVAESLMQELPVGSGGFADAQGAE